VIDLFLEQLMDEAVENCCSGSLPSIHPELTSIYVMSFGFGFTGIKHH
jgi:hypothetical protein